MAALEIRIQRHPRRLRPLLLALVVGALLGTGCSVTDDGYTYVNNAGENLFFKLPDDWKKYPVTQAAITDRPAPISGSSGRWAVEFDGAAKPDRDHLSEPITGSPVGFSEAYALSRTGQDAVNEKALRSLVVQEVLGEVQDPLDLVNDVPDRFEIVDYKQIRNKQGVWGSKIIVNILLDTDTGEEPQWLTIGQKVYLDRSAQTLRRLVVRCSSACYRTNRSKLDTVLNSFAFRP